MLLQVFDVNGRFLRKFGSEGSGPGRFSRPAGIAVHPGGLLVVCDEDNHRVQILKQDGTFVRQFGSRGKATGQFKLPQGVCVAADGRIFVGDANCRVQVFQL